MLSSNIDFKKFDWLIEKSFKEDLNEYGDVTSKAIIEGSEIGTARLVAKQDGVIAGLIILKRVFEFNSSSVSVELFCLDGKRVKKGEIIGNIKGCIYDILKAERIALNFLQRLSGIATFTDKFVNKVQGTNATILDTRKTTPCYRELEKFAVRMGGGSNHRFGLYDMVLIKENHIKSAGSIFTAVNKAVKYLKSINMVKQIKIGIEVTNITEVIQANKLPVNRIMFDNMSISSMREAVKIINGKKETEASGNVSLDNVKQIAETGVDFISIGSLTHSAPCFDISLLIVD